MNDATIKTRLEAILEELRRIDGELFEQRRISEETRDLAASAVAGITQLSTLLTRMRNERPSVQLPAVKLPESKT